MSRWSSRAGWLTAAVLALFLVAAFARDTFGGPLDPGGPPAPTMQKLDEIPGSWHRTLDATNGDQDGCNSTRFECVLFYVVGCPDFCHFEFGGVLDHETGLVWERNAALHTGLDWLSGGLACRNSQVGGRKGWRPPSQEELGSIFDPEQFNPALPVGHPFLGVSGSYWSSTTYYDGSYSAYLVDSLDGVASRTLQSGPYRLWCVRGGSGVEAIEQPPPF